MVPQWIAKAVWRLLNPLIVRVAAFLPLYAVLETRGRLSGQPRLTPVANGLIGDEFWILAVHGRRAAWVQNLLAEPRVRVRIGRRWREGSAELMPPGFRAPAGLGLYPRLGPRVFHGDAQTVRVELS